MATQLLQRLSPIAPVTAFTVFCCSTAVSAQSTLATVTGVVADQSNAIMPGVTVTATNAATGVSRTAVTTVSGEYQVPNLEAGEYVLLFRIDGFTDTTREVMLLARQVVRVDIQMPVAGAAELVEVRAATPVIETERATVDNTRSGIEIGKLALNFRATNNPSPIVVATLAQGVSRIEAEPFRLRGHYPS